MVNPGGDKILIGALTALEVCLNGAYTAWLRHQAELLVNEDKRARSLNDASVVAWTAATLDDCRKKGEASPGSVDRFGRHMARWRDHVFDHAESIRRRGQSDQQRYQRSHG
jgi:hypothetical protein